ncbi:MAG TPA: biotin-dependent carboxyltransferase family protein [Motiliproteus sp.]
MSFEVIKPGLLTLLQDGGRYGYQHLGLTTGGPMDEHAFAWANHLLGNNMNAAQLEITFGMLSLRATAETTIALTGADLEARLNGRAIQPWNTYRLQPGDLLEFNTPQTGLRAYLAVADGFSAPTTLGSCATVAREGLGGVRGGGAKLAQGDQLPFTPCTSQLEARVPAWAIPDYSRDLEVGVMLGYQHRSFPRAELNKLFSSPYQVSQHIDRMGYRLSGAAVHSELNGLVSEGIAFGAIQIPADGQPIVLMKDRQTIGGYPKVGSLSALGAGQLSQRGPGSSIRFYPMDVAEAEAERMIFNHAFSHPIHSTAARH